MPGRAKSTPRCAAIIGPYHAGKSSLLESLLRATGALPKNGPSGLTIADRDPESRAHRMGVRMNVATTEYLGDEWTFIDCPGSVEFGQDARLALQVADVAVVVVEPVAGKALTVAPLLHYLDTHKIPHLLFINKIDVAIEPVSRLLESLRGVSKRPLVLREVPLMENGEVAGFVDLVSEKAWHFRAGRRSEVVQIPAELVESERAAREAMVEALADFDDGLLEQVLEDLMPSRDEIYGHLGHDLEDDLIVPVFFGSAENDNGISRLLKALRHETPEASHTAERLGLPKTDGVQARVFKTLYPQHVGKLSLSRVFSGPLHAGETVPIGDGLEARIGSLSTVFGDARTALDVASVGQVVAIGRVEALKTGALIGGSAMASVPVLPPVYELALVVERRADEVKLSGALAKLSDEDPSFVVEARGHEWVARGQGELHLKVLLEQLERRFHLVVRTESPSVPYRETIRGSVKQHARFKRQTGGHGQFGDVHLEIGPNTRGGGLNFSERIVGGSVPKRYVPGVEKGVVEYMKRGPLGFPVVDLDVCLTDGSYHSVDSSEQAFKTAATLALKEALPRCEPVLLEPILKVDASVPSEFASRVQRVLTARRGQILAFEPKADWLGWDLLSVRLPQAEVHDLILEIRSLTQGAGTYVARFDHLAELTGRLADAVVSHRADALEGARN